MFLGNGFYQTKRGHGIFKVLPVAISSIIYNYAPDTVSVFWNTEMNTTGCASGTGVTVKVNDAAVPAIVTWEDALHMKIKLETGDFQDEDIVVWEYDGSGACQIGTVAGQILANGVFPVDNRGTHWHLASGEDWIDENTRSWTTQ